MQTPPTEDDGSLLEEDTHPLEEDRQVPLVGEHIHLLVSLFPLHLLVSLVGEHIHLLDRLVMAQQDTQEKQLVGLGVRSSAG